MSMKLDSEMPQALNILTCTSMLYSSMGSGRMGANSTSTFW